MCSNAGVFFAYDPRIITKYMAKAARDVLKGWRTMKMPKELQAEIDQVHSLGVIGSGWSVQEIGAITSQLSYNQHIEALTGSKPNLIQRGWRGLSGFTAYRENILRLAAFRYFKDRIAAGEKNIYGASNKKEVDGITNDTERSAKLARELVGDYGNITHAGQWLRRHLIPFYAWMEINAPRYVRMLRNLKHEGQGAKKAGRFLAMAPAKIAFKGTKLGIKTATL
jgi:hypothetical protein